MADEYAENSDRELEEILALATRAYETAKPEFLQHQREFNALQSRKDKIAREIASRESLKALPTKLGWYRDKDGDFWRLTENGWRDAYENEDVPDKHYGPFTWIGNEE